ncbi:hypothetical protein L596_003491 [Steinernema carpocapsae]|uniref:Uncharacterized protein n=1 Tax=Steinernema carpocapsae TaxID=34508 RepID=A0A4U8UTT3_STECR|nr:hypothetical protein L596_003491 [Steinernema carpocapsae]
MPCDRRVLSSLKSPADQSVHVACCMPGIRSRAYLYGECFSDFREYRVWLKHRPGTAMLRVIFGMFSAQDRANLCILRGAESVLS